MKKVLLATTALVFTAGYAAADGHTGVSVSGEAIAGMKYIEDAAQETTQFLELDFGVAGTAMTDSGIEVGASFDLDIDTGSNIVDGNLDEQDGSLINDEEVYISASGVTLTLGEVGAVDDAVVPNLADVGFDGIGIDDTAEAFFDITTQNILLTAEFGEITVAASGNMDEAGTDASEDYGVAASYDAGAFSVGGSFTSLEGATDELQVFAIGGSVTAAGADLNLFFHTADSDDLADAISGYGASVAYPVGALTLVGTVGATDLDDDEVDFGAGAEYDLGGGVSLAGGVGTVDNAFLDDDSLVVADFGIKMSF